MGECHHCTVTSNRLVLVHRVRQISAYLIILGSGETVADAIVVVSVRLGAFGGRYGELTLGVILKVENAIRPTAVGKKNWLFIGGAATGERSAIIYSVIESCRRRGIDPHTYLAEVLKRIPDATTGDIKELTPASWAKTQQASRLPAAA